MGALPGLKKKARSFDTLSTSNSSAFQIAMNREKAHRMLDNTIAAQDNDEGVADLLAMDSVTDLPTSGYQEETKEDMDVQIFRQLQYVAATAAVDAQYTHHWGYYIQCYAKVRHIPLYDLEWPCTFFQITSSEARTNYCVRATSISTTSPPHHHVAQASNIYPLFTLRRRKRE